MTLLLLYFQKACYLSINPLKEESMETEKAQYILPDGSSIEVGIVVIRESIMPLCHLCCFIKTRAQLFKTNDVVS